MTKHEAIGILCVYAAILISTKALLWAINKLATPGYPLQKEPTDEDLTTFNDCSHSYSFYISRLHNSL